ncbi:MAG: tetratricopeptide repeat protein [Phycisphaerae bacterium]|jgi:tetratricopeptide (TPR) repeat protein
MAKRIILISSFPLLVAIAIIAIVLAGIGHGQPASIPADIEQSKSQVISLIQSDKLAEADTAVDKIMALPVSREKGQAIQEIAGAYQIANQYNKAIQLCDYVLQNWPKEDFAVWAGTSMAFAQFAKGNTAAADSAIDRIITNCADSPGLPQALLAMAEHYSWQKTFDKAERLYGIVIEKVPDSTLAAKARLGSTCANALALIGSGKYLFAKQQVDLMTADFNDSINMPEMLVRVGKEFCWQRRYVESKRVFDLINDRFPDSPLAQETKLWSAATNVCAIIKQTEQPGEDANDEQIIAAIDKMISDFNGNEKLAETAYRIGNEYEWSKDRIENSAARYDVPLRVYQRLAQELGQTPYGQKTQWDYKRLTQRTNILTLMGKGDQNAVDTAIEQMTSNFKGRPEIAGEFHWVALQYEGDPNKLSFAKQMYERIVKEYPTTTEATKAVLDIRRVDIHSQIKAGEINEAEMLIDKFVADFNGHPYAGICLRRVATQYYMMGIGLKEKMLKDEANQYFAKAEPVWQRIIDKLPSRAGDTDTAYYYAACSRQQMGRWDDAIKYFQIVVDDWPDFEHVGGAQAAVGWCLEAIRDSNTVPKEAINPLIAEAYKAVLTGYADCYIAHYAAYRLGVMSAEKGDKVNAIVYYRKFLELAKPENNRINDVKSKLAGLEQIVEGGAGK